MPKSLPPALRRQIISFDPSAPDAVSISAFCRSLGISRPMFYKIRNRYLAEGNAALHPHSRAPKQPARVYQPDTTTTVITIRKQLKKAGWDAGPQSIWHTGVDDGLFGDKPPSVSTIARILADTGNVDANPRKRPRKSFIRFQRGAAMELWQLDAFDYTLFDTRSTMVTVYQLLDDSTRYDVGTLAFKDPENGTDALTTVKKATATHGVPQELLSDNGSAFNLSRLGKTTGLERYLAEHGCKAISGQFSSPMTQGKNERSHQTLQRFLDAHTPTTLAQVNSLIGHYREYYNYRRRHQSLPGHMTPAQAFDAAEHKPSDGVPIPYSALVERALIYSSRNSSSTPEQPDPGQPPADAVITKKNSRLKVQNHSLLVPRHLAGSYRVLVTDNEFLLFSMADGLEALAVPLPIVTADTQYTIPLWKVKGARVRDPKPAWTRKHHDYQVEHYPDPDNRPPDPSTKPSPTM